MTKNKLAIIGGSGLYDVEEFKERKFLKIGTPWGKPSDDILETTYNNKEVQRIRNLWILLLQSCQNLISLIFLTFDLCIL